MKNIKQIKVDYLKYITIIYQLELESVKLMIQEHYDKPDFNDTLFIINLIDLEIDLDYFKQSSKIYYNLEHAKDLNVANNKYVIEQYKKLGITEVWSMEPNCEMFDSDLGIRFMPIRYTTLIDKTVFHNNSRVDFDLGFTGIVGAKFCPRRNDFFNEYMNPKYDFSIKIMNGYNICSMKDEFTNCRYALDFHRTYNHNNQNQVRLFEHICLGHTVLSEKSDYNIFPGLIYEWENIDELNNLIKTVEPQDFSEQYKEMTYTDDAYERYRNDILWENYYNKTNNYFFANNPIRFDIINKLINTFNYKSYLEIGVSCGDNFREVNCNYKIGVDPVAGEYVTHVMTSDEYFSNLLPDDKFDIIFIDGLHLWEQCYRDIENSLNHLSPNGVIICHDMNPLEEMYQTRNNVSSDFWNGDVWKAFVKVRMEHNNLFTCMIEDCDFGLGVITWGNQEAITLDKNFDELTYTEDFNKNKAYLMNTVKLNDFLERNRL